MSTGNQMPTFKSFTITQPFLGAPLQFQPALGSKELEELIDAYVLGNACKQDKLSTVTIDFYNHATVDINTGSLVRRYDVMPWDFEQSPQSQSSGLSPPIFTPSPASSATFADSTYGSISTPPNRTRGSRVAKKTKKDIKKPAEVRLPGFSIMTKDGIDVTNSAGRGTKTKEQREHAHLMRIIKACNECKRKKIRVGLLTLPHCRILLIELKCDPSHRRSSHTEMSRTSTSVKPSPPSQSNPSPAASTPSLSRDTTQDSEKSSPPVDSFAIEDFVLFPEDDFNQWNPDMSIPGFDTQYSDFNMTNFDTFHDFDTTFSTMDDNLSFDFPSFDQSSSFSTQSFNNSSHLPNYNTQPWTYADVNSQSIPPTQQSDLDFFDSLGDSQNLSPTHTQQAHPQAVADESPGKSNSFLHAPVSRSQAHNISSVLPAEISQTGVSTTIQHLPTTFGFSPIDNCHQPQGSESSKKEIICSDRKKHQELLKRECSRIDDHGHELVNAFLSGNGEPHVYGTYAGQPVSTPGEFRGGNDSFMNTNFSRSTSSNRLSSTLHSDSLSFTSNSSPVHEETPWSFESTLSSSTKSRPELLQNTVEDAQGESVVTSTKHHESASTLARPSPSIDDASLSPAVRRIGDRISSRRTNFATTTSLDQQVSSVGTNLVPTHLAVSSSMSSPRSRFVVDPTSRVISGVVPTGDVTVLGHVRAISPSFALVEKSSMISPISSDDVNPGSSNFAAVDHHVKTVSKTQDNTTVPLSNFSHNTSGCTSITALSRTTLTTLAALALGLAVTVTASRHLEISASIMILYLLTSIYRLTASPTSISNPTCISNKDPANKSASAQESRGNFWNRLRLIVQLGIDHEFQRVVSFFSLGF
ncbi:hypothetical protein NHQ30_009493 [Ciborinia camelliae]|nr:hypothetical protein NHQ30_009493 [Ciborinia camelliae]